MFVRVVRRHSKQTLREGGWGGGGYVAYIQYKTQKRKRLNFEEYENENVYVLTIGVG